MDKRTFLEVLEVALLNFDGLTEQEIIERFRLDSKIIEVGIRLTSYLKTKQINKKKEEIM